MSIKSFFAKIYASTVVSKNKKWVNDPVGTQQKIFRELISDAKNTAFGKDHHFDEILNHADFVKNVPINDYEGLRKYVDRVVDGEENVLWPGKPIYFAKTSGTTSGAKYIPITKESMPSHIEGAKNAILYYINETGNADWSIYS